MAEHLGAGGRGSVTGIYLPGWIARNLPAIHPPLLLVAALLHGRNFRLTSMCAKAGPAAANAAERHARTFGMKASEIFPGRRDQRPYRLRAPWRECW
jgi:hypothetical protein